MGDKMNEIENLKAEINTLRDVLTRRNNEVRSFESAIKELVKDEEIDFDTAQTLADCFGISLTREYSVTVVVRFSGTVTVDPGTDIDDLRDILEASLSTGWGSGFDADFDCDEVEVESCDEDY